MIEVVLFDLGGVLIELGGMPTMRSWTRLSDDEIWQRWLASSHVRAFESGRSDHDSFASAVVEEFDLSASPQEFLDHFTDWPTGIFDGGLELLESLRSSHHVACLSNTNHLHWERFKTEMPLIDKFHTPLASHLTGHMKPDIAAFEHALDALGYPASAVLFFDDNQINVDAAREVGMHAELTRGVAHAKQHLTTRGILTDHKSHA